MRAAPKAVVHFNFLPVDLLIDARPIWSSLNKAALNGKIPATRPQELGLKFGGTAIHLGTRYNLMIAAIRELNARVQAVYELIPGATCTTRIPNVQLLSGRAAEDARDRLLLAMDSFLYEFRAFLELMATFAHGVMNGIDKLPIARQVLTTGKIVKLVDQKGKVRTHDFLLYLCDRLNVPTDWYVFLSTHRNFFTHHAAPYCAIEDKLMSPLNTIFLSGVRTLSILLLRILRTIFAYRIARQFWTGCNNLDALYKNIY